MFLTARFCCKNKASCFFLQLHTSISILPAVFLAMATNQFIVIKHSNKSHLQEHMSTFITAHMLEAAGSKDICGKLKCKFFLFPGYK